VVVRPILSTGSGNVGEQVSFFSEITNEGVAI